MHSWLTILQFSYFPANQTPTNPEIARAEINVLSHTTPVLKSIH